MPSPNLYGWDWSKLKGSAAALKYARRDLPHLDRAVELTRARRVAVQAGGSLGTYPRRLGELFDVVYTFEPAPALFPILVANSPAGNIVRIQAALGDAPDFVSTVQARRGEKVGPAHEGVTHISGGGFLPVLTLDAFELPVCDFLQLDVEGWESHALTGADATIRRCRPVLCLEVNGNQVYEGCDEDTLRQHVSALGYRFVERLESDEVFVPEEWV